MVLRKPSDYFKKDILSLDNTVQELVQKPELGSFSEAFDSFKNNLSNIEVLSEKVEDIQTEIQTLLRKEDLDRAMMSQLLILEQSIRDVQNKVSGINQKNLKEIRLDVSGLTQSVNEFLEVEVPQYKRLIVDSELRTDNRFTQLEENVNQTLEGIGEFVDGKYQELAETLQGINEQSLSGILEDFKSLENIIQEFKEQDIPKYKGLIVETERKTESKLEEFNTNLEDKLNSFESDVIAQLEENNSVLVDDIKQLGQQLTQVKEQDIPKYKGFIVETERKTENKLNEFQEKLDETVSGILEKVSSIDVDNTDLVDIIDQKIEDVNKLSKQVRLTEQSTEDYKNQIKKKVSDLEVNILRNESHIKVQNKNLEQIQEDVKSAIGKLNLQEIQNQNHKLGKKIKYLEEVFEKFNEKEILTENIIVEPPSTDNKDPLTPLDQNFVTLDQLQQHYRLFINRIQQQLATIGGGGETRLEFLDDVDRNTAKTNGYVLQYDSSVGKFIGTSSGGDSYWSETNAGIYTTGNVAIGTDVVSTGSTALWVQGDARITGILSVGTGTITLDPTENTIRVGTGITLDATNNIVSIGNAITLNSTTGIIEVDGSTIGSPSGDANYTGIVTASAFVGDGSGLTGIVTTSPGVEVKDNNTLVGTASTLNFGTDLDVTFAGGVATINVSIPLSALTDVNTSNLSGITTDYLMVYDPTVPGFKFVNPKTYFGINNDANPDPTVDDFGSY